MGIFDNIVRGASTQFGREFGRAGANRVLKGSNYYSVKNGVSPSNTSSNPSGLSYPESYFVVIFIGWFIMPLLSIIPILNVFMLLFDIVAILDDEENSSKWKKITWGITLVLKLPLTIFSYILIYGVIF